MLTTVFLSWTTRQPCFLSMMDMEVTLADYIGNSLRPPTPDFNRQEKGSFVLLLSRVELSLIGKKTSRAMLIHSSEKWYWNVFPESDFPIVLQLGLRCAKVFITCVLACVGSNFVNKTFLLGEEVALYCAKYLPDIIKDQKAYKEGKLQKVCLPALLILHINSWRVLPHFPTFGFSLLSSYCLSVTFFLKESYAQNKLLPIFSGF